MSLTNEFGKSNDVYCNDNSCLICGDDPSVRNLNCDLFEKFVGQNNREEEILKPHLWSMFVLTKVLHFPKEKCSEILLKTCGVSHPGDWFTLCHHCLAVVNNAYQLTRQMYKLEKQLQKLRSGLIVKLGNSFDKEREKIANHETLMLNVRLEIRNYFRPAEVVDPIKLEDVEIPSLSPASFDLDEDNAETEAESTTNQLDRSKTPPEDILLISKQLRHRKKSTQPTTNVDPATSPLKDCTIRVLKTKTITSEHDKHSPGTNPRTKRLRSSTKASGQKCVKWTWEPIDKELFQIFISLPNDIPPGEKVKCPVCGFSYVNIRRHLRSHRAKYAQFACSICKYAARTQVQLNYHLTIRHKELGLKLKQKRNRGQGGRPECSICKHTYSTEQKLREHLTFHKKYSKTCCPICHFPCVSETSLKFHTKRYHSVPKRGSHSKSGRTRSKLIKKEKIVKLPKWKCDQCPTYYRTKKELREHLVTHSPKESCSICKFSCESSEELENHLVTKHRPMVKILKRVRVKVPCEKCDFVAESKEQGMKHRRIAHPTRRRFDKCVTLKCDRCDYSTKNPSLFESHVVKHSALDNMNFDESSGKYCCKVCGAKFYKEKSCTSHVLLVHKLELSQNRFLCHRCDKSFTNEPKLESHIKKVHVNPALRKKMQREIACELCIRRFRTERDLEEHQMLKHPTDDPPRSVCDQCGMTFSTETIMKNHQRNFHLIFRSKKHTPSTSRRVAVCEKKCEHCGLTCVNLKAFKDHLRAAHPNLYKFHCTLCPAKYISGSNLRLHMTSCHGQGKETCTWCGDKLKSYCMNEHVKKFCKQNPARNSTS